MATETKAPKAKAPKAKKPTTIELLEKAKKEISSSNPFKTKLVGLLNEVISKL